ncbi:MAG: hypothetical protein ACFE9I_03365 [Candidatus Hermodarchaeota archaeon]
MKAKWEILLILIFFVILLLIVVLISVLIDWPLITENSTYLSEATFDFWSLGHFLAGLGMFMLVFTLYFIIKNVIDKPGEPPGLEIPSSKNIRITWLITLVASILWEIIENTLLFALGIKAKFDSIINATTDILIWGIGGLIAWYLTHLMFVSHDDVHAYYLFTFINLAAFFIVFILFGYLTFNI